MCDCQKKRQADWSKVIMTMMMIEGSMRSRRTRTRRRRMRRRE